LTTNAYKILRKRAYALKATILLLIFTSDKNYGIILRPKFFIALFPINVTKDGLGSPNWGVKEYSLVSK
jgi:hypothetical protein